MTKKQLTDALKKHNSGDESLVYIVHNDEYVPIDNLVIMYNSTDDWSY